MRNVKLVPSVEALGMRIAPSDFTPLPVGPSCETTPPADPPVEPTLIEQIQVKLQVIQVGLGLL